jgi:diaminohydroxyphosphoribosylaminopyrimidine deaminase/5-amino-6-(5-phosphoribosylamino)uracil reductase
MVGCVIVRDGEIVGEGFHQYDWRDHAEIAALKAAAEKARGATLYVNLEPCNHTGRTGPCTEAIIKAGVGRVVAGAQDPNPRTEGRGFERLRAAGIEVLSGVCEVEARELNAPFARWIRSGMPMVTLKSALTLDGQLALPKKGKGKKREWITSEESRAEVQRMRHASDALLTGIGTIIADDPLLSDRSGLPRRRRLLRAVLDTNLRLPSKSRIVKTLDDDLLVFTRASLKSKKARTLQDAGVEIVSLKASGRTHFLLNAVKELGRREILSVLIEAGSRVNGAALCSGCVHRLVLFFAPKLAGAHRVPLANEPNYALPRVRFRSFREFGPDFAVDALLRDPWAP